MVKDLRTIKKVIHPMGSLQSVIPLPSLLPKDWSLIVIDFMIPLQEQDKEKYAFSVSTYNSYSVKMLSLEGSLTGNVK